MIPPTILIIVGITGDLAKRKLLPALSQLAAANVLPSQFHIVGITRRSNIAVDRLTDSAFINKHASLFQMDLAQASDYQRLRDHLRDIEGTFDQPAQKLFYLSVPPQVSRPIIAHLGQAGLAKEHTAKLLLEKPFGTDLDSAHELIDEISAYFSDDQVYRIDHYLAKEMSQNILAFRDENVLFKRTWNKDFIESIRITSSEEIGIEGRVQFYEQTGALRDHVQSHLLQLAALTLMELPSTSISKTGVSSRRLAALQRLRVMENNTGLAVRRGQYQGYRQEVNNPHSVVETLAAVTLESDSEHWRGVPITLMNGKAMQRKYTEIALTYRGKADANELVLRLQPDEGAGISLQTKVPGYDTKLERRMLNFTYGDNERLPEAYERVILDAINSDHSLFTDGAEVLETWRILDPVQHAWGMTSDDLLIYPQGTDITSL